MTYQTNAFAHGIGNGAVSAQWYSRPADQKFLSLDSMLQFKQDDAARMNSRIVNTHKIKVVGDLDETNPSTGQLFVEYTDENRQENASTPTNWSFGQLAQLSGAPAGYLRDLPAPLAADCIQWGLALQPRQGACEGLRQRDGGRHRRRDPGRHRAGLRPHL
jgi:hypothetical protein